MKHALLLSLLLSLGCAGFGPLPSQGGRSWRRLETEHFVLFTDQPEEAARESIFRFEHMLEGYFQLGWSVSGTLPAKLSAVIFDDDSEFRTFGEKVDGFYTNLPMFDPIVVMSRERDGKARAVLNHELTHFIAGQSLPYRSAWLDEGLATYFESARYDDDGKFVVGDVPIDYQVAIRRLGLLPAKQLLTERSAAFRPDFYASSWLLVHYLMSQRSEAFASY